MYFSEAMALKHQYAKAYYDIYVLYYAFYNTIDDEDQSLKNYLLFNLSKAKELGYILPKEIEIGSTIMKSESLKKSEIYLKKAFE